MPKGIVSTGLICLAFLPSAAGVAARAADRPAGLGAAQVHTTCCLQIDVALTAEGKVYELPASSDTGSYTSAVDLQEQLIGQYQWGNGSSFIDVLRPGWAAGDTVEQQGIQAKDGIRDHWCTDNFGNRVYSYNWAKAGAWDPSDFSIGVDAQNVGPIVAPYNAGLHCGAEVPVFPGPGAPHAFGAVAGTIGWQTLWPGMSSQSIAALRAGRASFGIHCDYRTYDANSGEVRKGYISAGVTIRSFPEKQLKARVKATRKMTTRSFPDTQPALLPDSGGFGSEPSGTPPAPWPSGPTTKPVCSHK